MNKQLNIWLAALQSNATPSIDEFIEQLLETLPLLGQLKDTEQDPEWHAEGDVYIHTRMVLNELYALLDSSAAHITGERRQALILGTLLHDIGKPACTRRREIRGHERVIASRHENFGRSYLAYKLMDLDLPYSVVEQILGLVGEHHMPKLLVIKGREIGEYLALSRRANCELLYFLEVADMSGRHCPDKAQQLEYLELFKMFCQEYQLWGIKTRAYDQWLNHFSTELESFDPQTQDFILGNAIKDREKGLISTPEEAIARSFGYRNSYAEVVVMCGPSGAGKSSWIKKNIGDYHLVSLDDIREELTGDRANQKMRGQVLHEATDRFKHHLRSHHRVIWDATNLRYDFRSQIYDLAYAYQALVTLVVFQQPEAKFYQGNRNRQHAVPENVLQRQLETMQWPPVDEAHRVLVIGEDHEILRFSGGFQQRESPFWGA